MTKQIIKTTHGSAVNMDHVIDIRIANRKESWNVLATTTEVDYSYESRTHVSEVLYRADTEAEANECLEKLIDQIAIGKTLIDPSKFIPKK